MEGTSATSPSPILACPANPRTVPTISDSVNSLGMTELSDANSFSEINSRMLPLSEFSTPKKRQCFSQDGSLHKPVCDEAIKPIVGMRFDDIASVEAFYKKYAHHVGFGILRTTSRSESENSFFKNFIRRKLAFVEFWLRFDTALKCQRQEELVADHTSLHTTPRLMTCWEIERHGSLIFTHEVFDLFQSEVLAAREHCDVQDTKDVGSLKIMSVSDQSHPKNRVREVNLQTTTLITKCSCMLFENKGIVCRHVIRVLRGAKINELPNLYILKRWEKMCKRDIVYDGDGNPLDDNPIDYVDMETRRKISVARNKFEDLIRHAKNSSGGLDLLHSGLCDLESTISQSTLAVAHTSQQEQESFVGSSFPTQVDILTPTNIDARGTCSRIKGHRDKEKKAQPKKKLGVTVRVPRVCGTCKELVLHDSRKCPKKK